VLARLRAAFVASPGLAVYSRSSTHFERMAGPDDGATLLAAVTIVLDRSDRIAVLERTRAEIHGLMISELCEAKGWHRGRFYRCTDAAAERVAAYLNGQASKGGQKAADAEKYGCTATRSLKNNQGNQTMPRGGHRENAGRKRGTPPRALPRST
jgi:hypothetical protein